MLKRLASWLKSALFPRGLVCYRCGAELQDDERVFELCKDCLTHMPFREGEFCEKCGNTLLDGRCPLCENANVPEILYDRVIAPLSYADLARTVVLDYKDGGKAWLAENMVKYMVFCAECLNADFVTYVPSSKKARARRGFDHAEYLAKKFAEQGGRPFLRALSRTSQKRDNAIMTRAERAAAVKGVFVLADGLTESQLKDKSVILIDDVGTTGATVSECAAVLKEYGVKTVSVVAFCHAELGKAR